MKCDNCPSVNVLATTFGQQDEQEAPIQFTLFWAILKMSSHEDHVTLKKDQFFLTKAIVTNFSQLLISKKQSYFSLTADGVINLRSCNYIRKHNSFQEKGCQQIWTAGRLKGTFSGRTYLINKHVIIISRSYDFG